jgi:hypothetical protein
MIKRPQKRSVKARNPVAKDLREPLFHLRLKPSKKLYQRKPKHRGRRSDGLDSVWRPWVEACSPASRPAGANTVCRKSLNH